MVAPLSVTRTESYSMEVLTVRTFDEWRDLVRYLAGFGIAETGLDLDSTFTHIETIRIDMAMVPVKVIYEIEFNPNC